MSLLGAPSVISTRTIPVPKRTSLLNDTAVTPSALNIPTRCGKSVRALKRENGSTSEADATLTRANKEDCTFTCRTTLSSASTPGNHSILGFMKITGWRMVSLSAHHARSCAAKNLLPLARPASRRKKNFHRVTLIQKITWNAMHQLTYHWVF